MEQLCYFCFQNIVSGQARCPRCGHNLAQDRQKYPHALPWGTALAGQYITGQVLRVDGGWI